MAAETQMPPCGAIDSSRTATLTASPIRSSPLSTTSPRLMPMRRTSWSFGPAGALAERIASWISSAARTASTGLTNSASRPSPVSLKTRPRWCFTIDSAVAMRTPSKSSACSSSRADMVLNPTTSMATIVVKRLTRPGSFIWTG
jgi:hypothetical protein